MLERMPRLPAILIQALPELYIVGGAVRDAVMGRNPHDLDLATPYTPEEVTERLEALGERVLQTGAKHGTVTAMIAGVPYEITTYRADVDTDGRHATVEFVRDLETDLSRRDFTINAMAINARTGELFDPFNGQADIMRGRLNTVGWPDARFTEDYLRIIRAARFASTYHLFIRPAVYEQMQKLAPEILSHVSIERVTQEFDKAFLGERPSTFIRHLHAIGFLELLIPEMADMANLMQSPFYHPEGDVLTHTLQVIDAAPSSHRWHALLHDIGKPATAQSSNEFGAWWSTFHGHEKVGADMIPEIGARLRLPTKLIDSIQMVTRYHMTPLHIERNGMQPKSIRRFQHAVGEYLDDLRILCQADVAGRRSIPDVFTPTPEPTRAVLMGRHLIEAGYEPGPAFTGMLQRALDYQLETGCSDIPTLLQIATSPS